MQWVNACLGKDKASANFDFAGPSTETVLLGVLAVRYPGQAAGVGRGQSARDQSAGSERARAGGVSQGMGSGRFVAVEDSPTSVASSERHCHDYN